MLVQAERFIGLTNHIGEVFWRECLHREGEGSTWRVQGWDVGVAFWVQKESSFLQIGPLC